MTLLVLLDFSAAFDTVNHKIILRRMETTFDITGTVLQWFSSYLGNRSQRVVFGDGVSEGFYLACGVPRGSCLGPLAPVVRKLIKITRGLAVIPRLNFLFPG